MLLVITFSITGIYTSELRTILVKRAVIKIGSSSELFLIYIIVREVTLVNYTTLLIRNLSSPIYV